MSSDIPESTQDRTVETVRSSAQNLLSRFREKLTLLRGNDEVTRKILRQGFDRQRCFEEAIKFFGTDEVKYIAIDGTEIQEDKLDLFVFFAGAFAYGGVLRFQETGEIATDPPFSEKSSFDLSCAVPISQEHISNISGKLTEGGVETELMRIPQSLMHFAEYYLAYTLLKSSKDIRVVFMDRTVSGDIAHISWKMREFIKSGNICLIDFPTSFGNVSKTDLELGRMLVENKELRIPPPRSQFLKFAAMGYLMNSEPANVDELLEKLGAEKERKHKLFKDLTKDFREALEATPASEEDQIVLKQETKNYWNRLVEAVEAVADHIFNPPSGAHPLRLVLQRGERWITADDLDYLTMIVIYGILKEAWNRNILVLGIVKDSAANEFVRAVIKVLEEAKLLSLDFEIPAFDSDRMLLQANSVVNSGSITTPWRTLEYDVCFRTIAPITEEEYPIGTCRVMGAYKNVITCERMFVKSYFQLWSSSVETSVRSHVFLYDRPCYPSYDVPDNADPELVLKHKDNAEEKIIPAIHFLKESPISDLVMGVLSSLGGEPIPEALGHNYPLFLADKKAKWIGAEAAKACNAAVELEIARSRLDQQVLFEAKFRNYRSGLESKRSAKKQKK